jgi:hypothetical protein
MKTKPLLTLGLILSLSTALYAEDEIFNLSNTLVNESFIKVVAKNRANKRVNASGYTEIKSKEEFLEALDKGTLNNTQRKQGSTLINEYVYTEIKNTNINKNDLRGIQGDTLNLGTNVKRGKVTQVLKIKNSKIETDKELNLAVNLDANQINSATSFTQIKGSTLRGNSKRKSHSSSSSSSEDNDGLLLLDLPSH